MQRALVVIDVNLLYFTVNRKFPGKRVDYANLITHLADNYTIHKIHAYCVYEDDRSIKFIQALNYLGYKTTATQRGQNPPDWSLEMALDIVRAAEKVDEVIIMSSDRKLIPLLLWLKEKSIKTTILASIIPHELRELVDNSQELNETFLHEKSTTTE